MLAVYTTITARKSTLGTCRPHRFLKHSAIGNREVEVEFEKSKVLWKILGEDSSLRKDIHRCVRSKLSSDRNDDNRNTITDDPT